MAMPGTGEQAEDGEQDAWPAGCAAGGAGGRATDRAARSGRAAVADSGPGLARGEGSRERPAGEDVVDRGGERPRRRRDAAAGSLASDRPISCRTSDGSSPGSGSGSCCTCLSAIVTALSPSKAGWPVRHS